MRTEEEIVLRIKTLNRLLGLAHEDSKIQLRVAIAVLEWILKADEE